MGKNQGDAARRFREAEAKFVKTGPVEERAHEAGDALDGPEGLELQRSRRDTAKGAPR
jgi:hypothetical protein